MAKQNAVAHVHEEIMDLARGGMLKTKAHLAMGMGMLWGTDRLQVVVYPLRERVLLHVQLRL